MFKLIIFIFIFVFIIRSNAQKIYYSKPEGNFLYTWSHIIGQVKDHIIIWKYEAAKPERSQIIIYDNRMNILDRVRSGILNFGDAFTIDFINMSESFAVAYQYKTKTTSFCKMAYFDENGNCFKKITIDSVSARNGYSNYKAILSASQKCLAMIRTSVAKSQEALNLDYHLFDNTGALINTGLVMLTFNDLQMNELLLDSSNNLIIPVNKTTDRSSLAICKINLETGSMFNTTCEITEGFLANNTISINETETNYLITAQWRSAAEETFKDTTETGIFFWRLKKDLSVALNDTIFTGAVMPRQFFNNRTYFKSSSIILQNDVVYIISAPSYIASLSNYSESSAGGIPTFQALNEAYGYSTSSSGSHSFYDGRLISITTGIKTLNGIAVLNNMDPDDKSPTLRSATRSYLRGNSLVKENFQFIDTADMRLSILKMDAGNSIVWTKYFDRASGEGLTAFVNLAKILTADNALNLLYAVSGNKEKQVLEKIQFAGDGSFKTGPVFSMNLNYMLIFQKGVTISPLAVVFPCMIKNKLAFAKVDVE